MEKHFTGFRDEEDAIVFAVGEVLRLDGVWIAVTEIDSFTGGLGNLGGKGNLGTAFFDAVFEGAETTNMGRMGEDAPRDIFEAVPLFEKIIPAMIADGFDMAAVTDANFFEVRRVDDEFAGVGEDGFEFVHAFASGPKFVIHRRAARNNGVERFFFVGDVEFAGEVAGFVPCRLGRSSEEASKVLLRVNDHAKAKFVGVNHCAGAVDDFSYGSPFIADDHRVGDNRAKPMEEVQYSGTANAGKKVFVTAGKADDLMRKNRADDDDFVVFENLLVDFDRHVHREKAVGELADFLGAECADAFKRGGVVPFVVIKADGTEFFATFGLGDFEAFTNGRFIHGLVRTKRNENVEGLCDFANAGV